MSNEALRHEALKFSKALDEIAEAFRQERQTILQEMTRRGILQSGICGEKIAQASLKMLRAKIERMLALRKESIRSAPELAAQEHFRELEKRIHEIVELDCLRIPETICRACQVAETNQDIRLWSDNAALLKSEVSRDIRIMEKELKLEQGDTPGKPEFAMVAALPVEFAAIQAMLDDPREVTHGGTKYTIGRIRKHTVVAMLLTNMGNNFAAIGATKLIDCFPSIKDILMVGIAAGVPQPGEVRLGDIIVSDKGGVLQHDNVKLVDGKIEIRDTSQKPSAQLIRAVRDLDVLECQDKRPWEKHLARAASPTFDRPEAGPSKVHHGRIGSGNMLLRDAALRDGLARDHNLRAFEMEGSGIADATWDVGRGYLLVRGVSDYADAQKNDKWHPYAALAAAAYARAILEMVPETSPSPAQRSANAGVPAKSQPQNIDLKTELVESISGLAIRLKNLGLDYVEGCQVALQRWDKYLEHQNDFTRNKFESFPVLSVKHLGGGETSSGFTFVTTVSTSHPVLQLCPCQSVAGRQLGYPEIAEAGVWKAEFTVRVNQELISTESHFIQWKPGSEPEITSDPRAANRRLAQLVNSQVRITPVLPLAYDRAVYIVRRIDGDVFEIEKSRTGHIIFVPIGRVTIIPAGSGDHPTFELAGRLQWVTLAGSWKFFSERPQAQDEFGFGRSVSDDDEVILRLQQRGDQIRFANKDRITHHIGQGYEIVYDDQGYYLRRGDQLLMVKR